MKPKKPLCTICDSLYHYQTFCPQKPKKGLKTKKPLRASGSTLRPKWGIATKKPQKALKRARLRPQSNNPRSVLIVKLDRIFSIYIRRKDSINGRARCVTCNAVASWKSMHCGHFVSRRKLQTRWDTINCHVQCEHCNNTLGGNLEKYEIYIDGKYGVGTADDLRRKSNQSIKFPTSDIIDLISYYEKQVDNLDQTT